MKREFSSSDAKAVIKNHEDIYKESLLVEKRLNEAREAVYRTSEALAEKKVNEILAGIPIDEINRGKKGIRIKNLRDAGYETIADIAYTSKFKLSDIYGISNEAAGRICEIVNGIVSNASQDVKIRLSIDDRTYEATELVVAIARYRDYRLHAEKFCETVRENRAAVQNDIAALRPGTNGILWFFTFYENKKKASNAFFHLADMLAGEYGKEIGEERKGCFDAWTVDSESAWGDFGTNAISFFTILEEINPRLLKHSDSYGLSEDLSSEIQNEHFVIKGLFCTLRHYQEWGVKFALHQKKILLGDEMGLGKTIQAIATIVALKNAGETHFIVVCPASVIANWCREIENTSELEFVKIHGTRREEAFSAWQNKGGVAVTTYETTKLFRFEEHFEYGILVVDEAHYIKNKQTKRSMNVREMSVHAKYLLFMTGTALENKVEEMISLIELLQPAIAKQLYGLESVASAPIFKRIVAPVYFRRKREDVLSELPELIESKEWCILSKKEKQVYEQAILDKQIPDARCVSWNVDDMRVSSKGRRMMEIVEEAENDGRKTIIFSFFLSTLEKVKMMLGDKCIGAIYGAVSPLKRQEMIDAFDKAPAGATLVLQIQSGGTGLNIQSASVVIICEPQFKPSIENQAISRAYRMGQTRNVLVYRLLCENTIDERITERLAQKQHIFDEFADESVATEGNKKFDKEDMESIIGEEIKRIKRKKGI